MLEQIFKSIDEKVASEIEIIKQDQAAKMAQLEEAYTVKLGVKKEKLLRDKEEQRALLLREAERQQEEDCSFKIQAFKRESLSAVYQEALKKLGALDQAPYRQIIKRLRQGLPQGMSGEIKASSKAASALKELADPNVAIKIDLAEEGFVFVSPILEIDMRFSQLIEQEREKTDPLILNFLFA